MSFPFVAKSVLFENPGIYDIFSRYLNYGAIGVVIGHEITHGFDDLGSQYDGNGNAVPWWSPETIDAFTEQAQCFVDQYGNYSVPEIASIVGEENAHVLPFFTYYCQLGCGISRHTACRWI